MAKTSLREVLEDIAQSPTGITEERDAVTLMDLHLGYIEQSKGSDELHRLIEIRDEAAQALASTAGVCKTSVVAKSHAEPLEKAVASLSRRILKLPEETVSLLATHLKRVQGCNHTDDLLQLITVRDGARKALKSSFHVRKANPVLSSHAQTLESALDPLERLIDKLEVEVRQVPMGQRTGRTKGLLEEGFNPRTKKYEFHHPDEWENLAQRAPVLSGDVPPTTPGGKAKPVRGKTSMEKVDSGVSIQSSDDLDTAEARLQIERASTTKMRKNLTANVNGRTGAAKEGVKHNSQMASELAGLLKNNPELLEQGGLLSRISGGPGSKAIEGQGQHRVKQIKALDKNGQWIPIMDKTTGAQAVDKDDKLLYQMQNDPEDVQRVVGDISAAAERLASGQGQGDDANIVLQFIGCFVDGLTEVIEGQKTAQKQFEKVWPTLRAALHLKDSDKDKLLARVHGYKEIAGAMSDTLSGKGTRKGDTRQGVMPNDPRLKIEDDEALIKGDISGSMHSCLLAQELSESLFGGGGIKDVGAPVQVIDKGVLNARALDALALTAGGKKGDEDLVFHTAYEMINGMRAITGLPSINQIMATDIMARMLEGQSFTDAVEALFEDVPWEA